MEGIKTFQLIIRNRCQIRKRINREMKWLITICQDITTRLEHSLNTNILTKSVYIDNTNYLHNCIQTINSVPFSIPLSKLNMRGSYKYAIKISKLKFDIISIIRDIGCCQLNNILELMLDCTKEDLGYSSTNMELINILDEYYNAMTCEIYTQQTDNSYSLHNSTTLPINQPTPSITYPETNISVNLPDSYNIGLPTGTLITPSNYNSTKLKLFDNQLNELSIIKLTPFTKGLTLQLNGCKIYIPYKKTLLVLTGYFYKITQFSYCYYGVTRTKYNLMTQYLDSLNIDNDFKNGYIAQLSLRDILLYSHQEIVDNCRLTYNSLTKIRTKCISLIIKDFIKMDITKQRDIISNLLINNTNTENIYICYVLFDLLSQCQNNTGFSTSMLIYNSLSLDQQVILNKARSKSGMLTSDLLTYTDDIIPYEKRILLMKCSTTIKSKALEKLKEINSSKGGESSSKAQQYIEGLLNIPFGLYKIEPIINYINDFRHSFQKYVNKVENNINLTFDTICNKTTDNISTNQINITVNRINKFFKTVSPEFTLLLNSLLNELTCNNLKFILNEISMSKIGAKSTLILKIIKNYNKISLRTLYKYNLLETSLLNNNELLSEFIELETKWLTYKSDRKVYLENVENLLSHTVYGMDEAKQEMKRIIAQWINGNTTGYILGFEGPPGTGKTTLAKQGIAKCLTDENNKDRPFYFIALGGSTNGSTLEGHNYTYVGSTWGRIVEALMETQCMNPIIYIDELDKISRTEHGKELIGILIHLTDPSQNEEFMDKYFSGIKIDISKCLIIFSYNDVTKIDRVLLDRIHRIKIDALTRYDKCIVTRDHLIPEICKNVGFDINDIEITNEIIYYIIDNYTFEAGVRKLKEKIYDIIREINLKYILGEITEFPQVITKTIVNETFYNKNKIQVKQIPKTPSIGLVNGLYATSTGTGGITTIEAFKYLSENRLSLELTGQQGDVMKESMRVSKTVTWNLLPESIKDTIRKEKPYGLHIHCPEAAQPKDGPSAGTAITIAMLSVLSKIPVNNEIAVTGEIDLNGNVLPIGGLEYKLEGAKTAGVKLVLCPEDNREDLNKIIKSKNNPFLNCDFRVETIKTIYDAIDYMFMGDKCSSLFQKYTTYSLSPGDYLLTFKNMCDSSRDIIFIIDSSPDYLLLYASTTFYTLSGWTEDDIYIKPFKTFIMLTYHTVLQKVLEDTIKENNNQSCKLEVSKKNGDALLVMCDTQMIDNIISFTMRLL